MESDNNSLEERVQRWIVSRIGTENSYRRERAMRLFEEAAELCQSEGITLEMLDRQCRHVFDRPSGDPLQEAGGVAVCLLGYCAAIGETFRQIAVREIERIEAKPVESVRGSLARKQDADLVTAPPLEEKYQSINRFHRQGAKE